MKKRGLPNMLLSVFLILSAFWMPMCAQAAEEGYSLTVEFNAENKAIVGSEFKIYRVLDGAGKLAGAFAELDIVVGGLDTSESVDAFMDALSPYLDDISYDASGMTDAAGKITFGNLESGVYVFVGSTVTVDGVWYTPKSGLVRVPYVTEESGLVTDVVVSVKYESGNAVTPSPSPSLSPSLTPSATPSLTPSVAPSLTPTPMPSTSAVTKIPTPTPTPVTGTDEKLPQTGQLWWPVPILFVLGTGFFLTGIVAANLNDDEKE